MRRTLAIVVGILAAVGVAASVAHYLRAPYNPGFLVFRKTTAAHVVLGAVYLALAPFQFLNAVRSRWLGYHRWAGRALVGISCIVGTTALFIAFVIPFSGWRERVVIGFFGGFFLVAIAKGFMHIRAGRTALHREWMIRAFAIGLAIATMRLIFIPALSLSLHRSLGGVDGALARRQQIATLSVMAFTLAFVLHSTIAELWIRRTRRSGARGVETLANATQIQGVVRG